MSKVEDRRQFDKVLKIKLNNILEYNKRQDKLIKDIHRVIHGNGDPEKGLLLKHSNLSSKHTNLKEDVDNIKSTLRMHWVLLTSEFLVIVLIALKTFSIIAGG
ncbi:MAG: hypothetical protein KGY74_10205 [Candidatus Cloacimonetes bacterium]|nr:hypothetical protein [Candidatus Cloacimonadota bacterium]